jgi:hypothetical protein
MRANEAKRSGFGLYLGRLFHVSCARPVAGQILRFAQDDNRGKAAERRGHKRAGGF